MQNIGNQFEIRACDWLKASGLKLLARNFHTRHGELDLVMRDGNTIVFVEVRYRRYQRCGSAIDSITKSKRDKLVKAASHWLASRPNLSRQPCRFDIVAFDGQVSESMTPQWIRHAFDAF